MQKEKVFGALLMAMGPTSLERKKLSKIEISYYMGQPKWKKVYILWEGGSIN